jgi:hypothetical protein
MVFYLHFRFIIIILWSFKAFAAKCMSASDVTTGATIWNASQNVLMASCHSVRYKKSNQFMLATDCVDGKVMPTTKLPKNTPFSQLVSLHQSVGNRRQEIGPIERDLRIASDAQLMVNLEGCLNTMRNECYAFHHNFSRNGSGFSAASRFPCYYSKNDTSFAVHVSFMGVFYF